MVRIPQILTNYCSIINKFVNQTLVWWEITKTSSLLVQLTTTEHEYKLTIPYFIMNESILCHSLHLFTVNILYG